MRKLREKNCEIGLRVTILLFTVNMILEVSKIKMYFVVFSVLGEQKNRYSLGCLENCYLKCIEQRKYLSDLL